MPWVHEDRQGVVKGGLTPLKKKQILKEFHFILVWFLLNLSSFINYLNEKTTNEKWKKKKHNILYLK